MKNTKFLRITALLIAVIMMMSLCLVSCNDGENAETTPAETTPAETTPAATTPAATTPAGTTDADTTTELDPSQTTAPTTDEPQKPAVDLKTASGIAALINANLADMIPTAPEGGEQGSINIGNILGQFDPSAINVKTVVADLIKSFEGANVTIDNISGSLVEGQELPEKFQLSNNFLYMFGKDENGNDVKAIAKLTADGVGLVGSAPEGVMPLMAPISFEEFYARIDAAIAEFSTAIKEIPGTEMNIDVAAIKTALTVKEDDLVDMGNGVWQLKATYVVNAIKTVLAQFGVKDADLADAKELFDLILAMNMTADLSKYETSGELTLKLEIPEMLTLTIYSSATVYTVNFVAGQIKASLNATLNETRSEITFSVTELDKEVLGATFAVVDNGNKMVLSAVANVSETDEAGNEITRRYEVAADAEVTATGFTYKTRVKCDGIDLMKSEYAFSTTESGAQMSMSFEEKISNSSATVTANIGTNGAELHVSVNSEGVEAKVDLVINPADANGEIVKISATASGTTVFSFTVKNVSTDANGASKLNIALVTPEGDFSFDVSVAAGAVSELTEAEKSVFALCDNFLANYATYMAQLADYDAKVEAAAAAGKELAMDFVLVDKTNPNVIYHYYVFSFGGEYEIDGFIDFAIDTTGYNVITEADLAA